MPVPSPRPSRASRRGPALLAAVAVAASGLALAATPGLAPAAVAAEPAAAGVVVNEILYDDLGGAPDAIELYNASAAPVDVSGWRVQDDARDGAKTGTVPPSTVIAPGGYLVLTKDAVPGFPFGLGKGDAVFLFGAGGLSDADLVDSYPYAAGAPLGDWSRCADGGEWAHATAVTLGSANACAPVVTPEEPGSVVLSEIDSGPADWVELINPGDEAFDLSGYELRDNSDDHRWFFAAGTEIAAGARLVVEATTQGVDAGGAPLAFQDAIGIGGADSIRLFAPDATLLDSYSWAHHPAIDGSEAAASWARCPDATGPWSLARVTPGAANDCVLPKVAVNEVESNGDATDWVEIVNTGTDPVDLTGWTLMDSDPVGHAADVTPVPAGTVLAPGALFVFDGGAHFGFGLGAADVATVRNAAGVTVAEYAWTAHAAGTWARCGEAFVDAPVATKGAANDCGGETPGEGDAEAWPGAAEVTVLDETPMFLKDSSGLDAQQTADGVILWAVDNGTGRFWKLRVEASGAVSYAEGWEQGKRARFQRDAGNPAAKGPDTEGITVDGDGRVYLASERDNGNKGVNQNTVLEVDPDAPGPDVVATREWDLTASLPQVAANTGIEAVEWVSDAALQGLLVDQNTGTGYDPVDYPGHGDGLFFVALEDNGFVYAYALGTDGSIDQVATIDPGMGGAMALDYDTVLGELWVVCDNGCDGQAARIAFTGGEPTIRHFARPAGMPNTNNEGFATAPASLSTPAEATDASPARAAFAAPAVLAAEASLAAAPAAAATVRPVWWFEDGVESGALRIGTVPGAVDDGEPGGEPGGQPGGGTGGGSDGSGPGGSGSEATGSKAAGLAETGVDPALLALVPIGLIAAVAGVVLLLAARRRRSA